MARSHHAKEQRRLERIATNHPTSATDRCYEYARIKKLEKRVLNKREKHVIKMKDSTNGQLTKLNEKLLASGKTTKITKKSKHIHPHDVEKVKSTDFGDSIPYFQSSRHTNTTEQNLDDMLQILEKLPAEELLSDCKNPKVSRIIQNAVRHSSEENMQRVIKTLFGDKTHRPSRTVDPTETREGLCFDIGAVHQLLSHPYSKFLQEIAQASSHKIPQGCDAFLDICADNHASFIICTLIRRATHVIFKQMLFDYCIPYLPIILNHKSAIRIFHFLFINRFCGKKERRNIILVLTIAAIGINKTEIVKNSSDPGDTSLDTSKITDLSGLLDREMQCWQRLSDNEKGKGVLHAHRAVFYICNLFIDKLGKSISFPLVLEFLQFVLLMDEKGLPALLLEQRKELISNVVVVLANSMSQIFTSSVAMAQEWSEKTYAVLSQLFKLIADDYVAILLPEMAPHIHRLLGFMNERGRYGSHRVFVTLVLRCSATSDAFTSFSIILRHILRDEGYKAFRKNCIVDGRKRRKRGKGFQGENDAAPNVDSLVLICEFSLCLLNDTLPMYSGLRKSFFGQYTPSSFPCLDTEDQKQRAFLIILVLVEEIHRCSMTSTLKHEFIRDGLMKTYQKLWPDTGKAANPKWAMYTEKILAKIGCNVDLK